MKITIASVVCFCIAYVLGSINSWEIRQQCYRQGVEHGKIAAYNEAIVRGNGRWRGKNIGTTDNFQWIVKKPFYFYTNHLTNFPNDYFVSIAREDEIKNGNQTAQTEAK